MNGILTVMQRMRVRMSLTEGEQSILLAFFGVGFFGAALALNVVTTLGGHADMFHAFSTYDYWIVLSGATGGCVGLYMGRNWMGLPGMRGIVFALIGMIWISFLGGLVGGTLALPIYGTMFGPFTLFVSLFSAPLLALFWGCILLAAHFLIMMWRTERDSIFHAVMPAQSEPHLL